MTHNQANTKIVFTIVLLCAVKVVLASFTGSKEDRKGKFSLKNLDQLSKSYSLTSLRSTAAFQFRGTRDLNQQKVDNSLEINSMMRMERGNTTYIFPYKYKVKVSRFKTPVPPSPSFR